MTWLMRWAIYSIATWCLAPMALRGQTPASPQPRDTTAPYVLPPATPKERIDTLQNAFRKALNDSEFHKEFLKLVGDEVEPVLPEELTKIIRETPRDAEVIDLLKILAGAGPLPAR